MAQRMPRELAVKLKLPFVGEISGNWAPQQAERKAAWELYVELSTRISVVPLGRDEGLARGALSSLYTIFGSTREILRKYGPETSPPKGRDAITFGRLALTVLTVLRPVTAYWHPRLEAWEVKRAKDVGPIDHENAWDRIEELREALETVRQGLQDVAEALADVANAGPLTPDSRLLGKLRKERGGG
ncbi:hypothetical protein [Amycolatopsis jiangsuensis]|uniref:Uncharacterized protein n=2 Tax=Amycolatopsis jiangsuensis TaxID=1181879 RepID=A0A840J1R2_9PSEU|nr:hypothetical protein [Amycolatopsis jiangsuensis]MBB4687154.1 hypothetical protein [Amycolatopsis jiangsuensis]